MIKQKNLLIILVLSIVMLSNGNSIAQEKIKSVKIGDQMWMVENLNVSRFRNGDLIPEVKTNEEWKKAGKEGKPAWCYYDNNPENGKKYGKLYNWYAVNDKRGLAPKGGWHIPTYAEFQTLGTTVSNDENALKAVGQGTGDGVGTNTSGFSALLAGYREYDGDFSSLGHYSFFWSSTEGNVAYAGAMLLSYVGSRVSFLNDTKGNGFSVRCVNDF